MEPEGSLPYSQESAGVVSSRQVCSQNIVCISHL